MLWPEVWNALLFFSVLPFSCGMFSINITSSLFDWLPHSTGILSSKAFNIYLFQENWLDDTWTATTTHQWLPIRGGHTNEIETVAVSQFRKRK